MGPLDKLTLFPFRKPLKGNLGGWKSVGMGPGSVDIRFRADSQAPGPQLRAAAADGAGDVRAGVTSAIREQGLQGLPKGDTGPSKAPIGLYCQYLGLPVHISR